MKKINTKKKLYNLEVEKKTLLFNLEDYLNKIKLAYVKQRK